MGSASSGDAIRSITDWAATPRSSSSLGTRKPTEDFGSLTFNEEVQRARLPKEVFRSLRRAIAHGEPIDHSVADIIASALKDWAVEHGATHYTHWFQPLTGITAEKHDAFSEPDQRRPRHRRVQRQGTRPRASPTRRASRRAACAQPSRPAATPRGIRPARPGFWSPRTAPRW